MDDEIIDLGDYRAERSERTAFSVAGGGGEASRLALPVWRAVYLLGGDRGGIVWTPVRQRRDPPHSFFVLDLARDPARTEFQAAAVTGMAERDPPALEVTTESVSVLLARDRHRSWFMLVTGRRSGASDPNVRTREDLLFLAGECAGLLIHRGLGGGTGERGSPEPPEE